MAKIHPGATLTPHFRDFVPPWVRGRSWYRGAPGAALRPVGYLRLEDPAGRVGIETHLLTDGSTVYQVPLTYRDAPLPGAAGESLLATAEHSVLGTRWIYDGAADPVWVAQVVRLVATAGMSDPSGKGRVAPAAAHGHPVAGWDPGAAPVTVELVRVLRPAQVATGDGAAAGGDGVPAGDGVPGGDGAAADGGDGGDGVVGVVTGSWHPDGPDAPAVTGLLAVLRRARPGADPVVSLA